MPSSKMYLRQGLARGLLAWSTSTSSPAFDGDIFTIAQKAQQGTCQRDGRLQRLVRRTGVYVPAVVFLWIRVGTKHTAPVSIRPACCLLRLPADDRDTGFSIRADGPVSSARCGLRCGMLRDDKRLSWSISY